MASGTISFNKSNKTSSNSYILGKINYSYTQSTSDNTSTIIFTVYVKKDNDSTTLTETTNGTFKYQLVVNGETITGSKYLEILTSSKAIGTFTRTIQHDNDGSKTLNVSGSVWLSSNSSSAYYGLRSYVNSNSGSVELATIPRASSITSASATTLGDKCSIKWTPLASSFAYKVKLSCGNITHTSDYITPGDTSAYTYAATMSIAYWAGAMPNAYSGVCTATLYTYASNSSSNAIGSDSATFTLSLPKNSDTLPSVSFATPTLVNGWNGYYIQGKSKCTLSATFAAGEGSSINSCSISGTGLSKTGTSTSLSGTTSILTNSGTFTYTAKVTDGRASASATKSIYVYPYANPTLSLSAARTSISGSVKITYKASCSSVNSKNSLSTLKIYKKLSTASTYPSSAEKTITLSGTSVNTSITLSGFEATSSYDFYAVATDTYGSSSAIATASIASEFRILNINADKKGLSIGKMSEDNTFDCALPSKFSSTINFKTHKEDLYGTLETDYNESGNNIVYIRSGQDVEGGASMALSVHRASVYIAGEANDGLVNLGTGSRRWNQLYAANGTISTSDRVVKTEITNMSDTQERLFNKLQPVTFKFANGTSGRTHYGFISQDIENSLNELSLTGQDFAGFCKDLQLDENGNALVNDDGSKRYNYSLRYSEFIALNTYMIQKLQAENQELRNELQALKEMILSSNASSNNVE